MSVVPPTGPAVLVTGVSSGIGRATAVLLHGAGHRVYAGVRSDPDAEAAASLGLIPLRIDLTDAASIRAAARRVTDEVGERGLLGLVNNAGIVVPGPLEYVSMADLRRQLEVCVVGQLAMIQEFLPLLRRARGRIVNVSSVSGRLASPFLGAYSVAKYGFEAMSDALRLELRPWGIHVCVVQPGPIATQMPAKVSGDMRASYDGLPPQGRELYAKTFPRYSRVLTDNNIRNAQPPELAARVVHRALTARTPRTRYAVGTQAGILLALSRVLPDRLLDRITITFLERYRLAERYEPARTV